MTSIKTIALTGLFAFAALSTVSAPASAMLYDWTLTGKGITGSGQLTTGDQDNGGFDITSFSGKIGSEMVTGLLGGNPGYSTGNGNSPSVFSPSSAFYYDNVLYPDANSDEGAVLDNSGLLFSVTGHSEANIYGNSSSDYGYYTWNSGYDTQIGNSMSFTIDPVPEPASMALLGAGLFGLGTIRRRRSATTSTIR